MCDIAAELDHLRQTIIKEVFEALEETEHDTDYTVVWQVYEKAVIEEIIKVLKANIKTLNDDSFEVGVKGKGKNRVADLAVKCIEGTTSISIKAARTGGSIPANDLGTFKQYPSKKKNFLATFEMWVRYDSSKTKIRIHKIYFDRAYKFVGKHQAATGVNYRKKDGNMRPKKWKMFDDDTAFWNTPQEFEKAFIISKTYRANSLVEEHYPDMTKQDQRKFYDKIKGQFESPKPKPKK